MPPSRSNLLAAALTLVSLLLACPDAWGQEAPAHPLLERTDAIAQRVGARRSRLLHHPLQTSVKTRDQLRDDLAQRLKTEYAPGEIEGEATLLKQLGLLPEDTRYEELLLALLTEQIAGYYDTRTQALVLIDGGDPDAAAITMAHEIFHAIQDQHFTLRLIHPPRSGQAGSFTNGDRALARTGLIEGDATVAMIDWLLAEQGALPANSQTSFIDNPLLASLIQGLIQQSTPDTPALKSAPLILRRSLEAPYFLGLSFVQAVRKGRTWADLDAVYADPPESSEQLLHPERYLQRDDPTLISLHLPTLLPHLPPGADPWTPAYENVLGELRLLAWLDQLDPSGDRHAAAAAGWDGDRLYALTRGQERLVIGVFTWDSPEDAQDFLEALLQAQLRRFPAATLHRDQGPHGALACLHDPQHGRVLLERWGDQLLLIDGAPEHAQGAPFPLGPLRDAAWKARRVAAYPAPAAPAPLDP